MVQAFCYSKYLGYFELNFDTNGELKTPVDGIGVTNARPVLLDSTIAEEPKVQVPSCKQLHYKRIFLSLLNVE